MRKTYSYNEAVKILGGREHPIVAAMDKLLGGALLAGSLGLWQVLDLFDAKPDFIKLSNELISKVSQKRRKVSRYTRTQQLHAAHAVLVMTAFFEAFEEQQIRLKATRSDREIVAQYNPWRLNLPLPSVGRPYEENLAALRPLYDRLGVSLLDAVTNSASWDSLNETERDRVREAALRRAPVRAVQRYEELLGQLAAEYPEIRFWCAIQDAGSTRKALARLEEVLCETTTDLTPEVRLAELAGAYRGALARPLVKSTEVPEGVQIPSLADAYIDPRFQVVIGTERAGAPSLLAWWDDVAVRADLHAYLVGYLTSPMALTAPLLVLGDPGSGKSVLTEMLAARLPASDFAVVRVELRSTPADADLKRQIEHGLRTLLHEPVSWADFSRNTGGALPVVVLDGFDELLQATGVSQTRYLTVIADFQQTLKDMGRPAVFVVTSRLSVCAGLQLPEDTHVVRLLPFSEQQVRSWLDVWNSANVPLPAETVLEYPDLASQPLLLLMLALYDAVDSSFQRDHLGMSRGQLYERLLDRFTRREVTKDDADRSEADLAADVEFELERLSVVALAMFNRGAQWVAEHEVTSDLAQLLDVGSPDRQVGTRTPLSAGETVLGRFFFVQKTEAVREDNTKLRTYEFLHATFGEYLVARFVWERLLILQREDAARSRRKSTVDDTELYSVLSFMTLSSSVPLLDFLREFARKSSRDGLFDLVARLLGARDERRLSRGEYEPVALTNSVRDAKYSVNLMALAVVLKEKVYGSDLRLSADDWRREALFWKSRLSGVEWTGVVRCFWVEWDPDRHFVVGLSKRTQDVRAEWLLMTEPDVTLDDFALMLRDAVLPLVSQHGLDVTAALINLMATPIERVAPAIRRLAEAGARGEVVLREADARLGLGGDDVAIIKATYGVPGAADREVQLDAWLRLHERGFRFELVPEVRDLTSLLTTVGLWEVFQRRPDLFKRATAAAAELGLERPLPNWQLSQPDRPR
ncbi:ATP-binding protein [Lentzea sp. BCCO 10_0856]|uniref:ATP-binding protein n=1 Tax=Lentzea miocenica TaxID=3095431 RepID=A0ABU4SX37_9PSEU|nr:ATP-binding protein [Lentzea sp. BCCO 10_0856]MDX8030456.1 ATP-binding protein [Lentzea sp. BCCO 10_0856]